MRKKESETPRKPGNFLYRLLEKYLPWSKGWLHLALFFLSLVALDGGLQYFFRFARIIELSTVLPIRCFTIGWALLFTGIAAMLPGLGRRIFMVLVSLVYTILAIVHGVFINMFRKFFSFADMFFAGDGAAFLDGSYLMIRKLLLLWILCCFALTVLAALLTPPKAKWAWKGGIPAMVLGLAVILGIRYTQLNKQTVIIWNQNSDPSFLYEDFSDTKACLTTFGLYQYTFRDLTNIFYVVEGITDDEEARLEEWMAGRTHADNEMSGLFQGKNLILVQLEAIDTWMLSESYMPNLWNVKQNSIIFENHYTPAYIAAGTFNTEFMVNTGLMPATGSVSTTVYTKNTFSNSIANLFKEKGYTTESFHGSEAEIYNRGAVHENLGYERYWSGSDMNMAYYQMDRYLMNGYEEMVDDSPFFTFIITYSGHGAYGPNNAIGQAHMEEALAVAQRTEENYVYAVSHAMETDLFIGELIAQLEADGLMEDTVLVFYADHYNYYMLDDNLQMEIKGVDGYYKLTHTDFFIYDGGQHTGSVEKVTNSLDVLPTIANLFGLDADYSAYLGYDAYSDDGGLVFFPDNSWYDGEQWGTTLREEVITTKEMGELILRGDWYAKND